MTHKTLGEMTAPDKIWSWCFQDYKDGNWDGEWGAWGGYARQTNLYPLDERERATGAEYTRSDLIAHAPEVLALVEALNHAQYGLSWAVRYFKDQDVTKDGPCPPATRGLAAVRAALAPFTGKER